MAVSPRRLVLALVAAAIVAIAVFGFLASRAVTVEEAPAPEALRRFESIRAALGGREPLIALDEAGNVIRRAITAADLERFDPSVVIDHARANGDRLLVWTE